MKVTALIENTKCEDADKLTAEHGLSLHIETAGGRILFDTGMTQAFARNADELGIDLGTVDSLVISHHHLDHGGGLSRFLELNGTASVFLRKCDNENLYFRAPFFGNRYIGLDQGLLSVAAERLTFVDEFTEILPGVFILTDIPRLHPIPKGNRWLRSRVGKTLNRDSFDHELILVVREADGLVVFTGCSHNGVLNMVEAVTGQFPGETIKALFGGFHMIGLPIANMMAERRKTVRAIGASLLDYPIERVYTGHCTGMKAYRILKGVMAKKLEHFPTGSEVAL